MPDMATGTPHLIAGGAYVVVMVGVSLALPSVNEVPEGFPAVVLWQFRIASAGRAGDHVDDDGPAVRRVDGARGDATEQFAAKSDGAVSYMFACPRPMHMCGDAAERMTTRLKLLCHASTSAVRTSAFPADEPLDTQGRQKLAPYPQAVLHADRYLTSPALRATQTAEVLRLNVTIEPMLRDCDYGRWAGRSSTIAGARPEAIVEWMQTRRPLRMVENPFLL